MKNLYRTPAMVLAGIILTSATHSIAQDWPQWRGPNRDAKVAGFTPPATWPKEFARQWTVAVGDGVATPALVGDKLYVFARQEGNEVTLCLDAATGKEIWRDQYEALGASGPSSRFPGPRSSPAVAEGKVITYGVRGMLSCLDASTGKVLWRKGDFAGAVPQFFTAASPLVVDGVCIAQLGGTDNGGIVTYNLATGDPKWRWTDEGSAYASPVLMTVGGTRLIVTLTANSLVAIGAADGQLAWKTPFVPERRAYNAATPIIDGDTIIYTGAGRGTKAVKLIKQGTDYSAQELWSNPDLAVQFNTPVLENDLLFGLSNGGDFFCLEASSGKAAWTKATGERGGFGSIVGAGAVLLALTPESQLVVLEPAAAAYNELARIKVADTPTHAYPVVAGKRLYIKDQDSLTLWTLE